MGNMELKVSDELKEAMQHILDYAFYNGLDREQLDLLYINFFRTIYKDEIKDAGRNIIIY